MYNILENTSFIGNIVSVEVINNKIKFLLSNSIVELELISDKILRHKVYTDKFCDVTHDKIILNQFQQKTKDYYLEEHNESYLLKTEYFTVQINKAPFLLITFDNQKRFFLRKFVLFKFLFAATFVCWWVSCEDSSAMLHNISGDSYTVSIFDCMQ